MPKIYTQATRVIVDIGEQVDDSDIVLHMCADFQTLMAHFRDQKDGAWPNLEQFDRGEWGQDEWWSGLISLCSRPWFRRVWVVQEMLLARSVKMLCGHVFFEWFDLATVIRNLNRDGMLANVGPVAYRGCQAIMTMEPHRPGTLNTDTIPLLAANRVREATDPRDRVYAIMGIAADKQLSTTLGVDYSLSTEQVFEDTARYLIGRKASIEVLYEAGGPKNLTRLPSWAPDWIIGPQSSLRGYEDVYNASGRSTSLMEFDESGRRLHVRGFVVDEIQELGTILVWSERPSSMTDDKPWHRISEFLEESTSMIQGLGDHYTPKGGSTAEAFWRTLIGNKTFKDKSTPRAWKYSKLFDAFQRRCQTWYSSPPEIRTFLAVRAYAVSWWDTADEPLSGSREPRLTDDIGYLDYIEQRLRLASECFPYQQSLEQVLWGRLFGTTLGGYMGLLPLNSQRGDRIAVIAGSNVPFVIRKGADDEDAFRLIGDCYVHGMMSGEMVDSFSDEFAPSADLEVNKSEMSLVLV
ncbi:MAG: hypothetical protein L6R38_008741 [Xanthoria sp. 2 TBL-2021]|nr:MAG: hypothetical protein L6R38_008741 [Xanthoria sp. 2 TBL-2021]